MLRELFARKVIFVLGKGGVGKTTLSAVLALIASQQGLRVLAMECDQYAPMAALLSVRASLDPVPVQVVPGFSLMTLDGCHALEEYLRMVVRARSVLRAVFASRLYQFFVHAAPGLRELMMLGKIYYEAQGRPEGEALWDLIIVDAPASGQALSLLRMPLAARQTFGESVVGREARNILRMLHDKSRCAIVQVTTAEPLAVSETVETCAALRHMGLGPAAVFFNRVDQRTFDYGDITTLMRRADDRRSFRHAARLEALARSALVRRQRALEASTIVGASARAPLLTVPDHGALSATALVRQLSADIASLDARKAWRPAPGQG